MKHGKQHTFTIVDDRILRERRDKSNTILRLLAACALRALQACPTHFYEYPFFHPALPLAICSCLKEVTVNG